MKKIIFNFIASVSFVCIACSQDSDNTIEETIQLNEIPESANIIFHENNIIYTMDENGENRTQITFDDRYVLEHVALSYDQTRIITNHFSDPSIVGQSSKLLLYDLVNKTLTHLLPEFTMAGNGGVDWDNKGFIYFAAVAEPVFPNPVTVEEFQANAGANDIYRMKFDGSGLQNLTNTKDRGEADVSVSPDSQSICYMTTNITDTANTFTEIWKRNVNGTDAQILFVGGEDRVSSVHDPEISPDGNYVVFSQVNTSVLPVFPDNPLANTAHDIVKASFTDSNDVVVITQPGPISIAPDWKNGKIVFLEITDKTVPPHTGLATINTDGTGYKLIKNGTNIGKWIPN